MFSGRDEGVSDDERYSKRYPVSQIAYDLEKQTPIDWQPMRDWFPALPTQPSPICATFIQKSYY
jgi:hypothetical protein